MTNRRLGFAGYRAGIARNGDLVKRVARFRARQFFKDEVYDSPRSDMDKFDCFSILPEPFSDYDIRNISKPLSHLIYVEHLNTEDGHEKGIVGVVRLVERRRKPPHLPIDQYMIFPPGKEGAGYFVPYLDLIEASPEFGLLKKPQSQVAGFALRKDYHGKKERFFAILPLLDLLRDVARQREIENTVILSRCNRHDAPTEKNPACTWRKFGAKLLLPQTYCNFPGHKPDLSMPASVMYADFDRFSQGLDRQIELFERWQTRDRDKLI